MTSSPPAVAIVTGAASGIGRAAALRLAGAGWAVGAIDVNAAGLDDLAGEASTIHPFPCDVTDRVAVTDAVLDISREVGPPRRLVHCAGIAKVGRLLDQDPADALRLMTIHYGGTLHLVHAVVPVMVARGGGQVVLLGSIAGWVPVPLVGGYGAAKAAVHVVAETLAAECRSQGIQVLCVCPPAVKTPMLAGVRADHPELMARDLGISTDTVLDAMDRALTRRRPWAFPGRGTHALWTARRLAPGALTGIIGRALAGKVGRE